MDRFALRARRLVPGLYQVAYSARTRHLFVTAAEGGCAPVRRSLLLKVDPASLMIGGSASPPAVADPHQGTHAVYGVAVDDARGTVWVTNTLQGTVAVYRQSDLGLLRQFPPGLAPHAREVVVDGGLGLVCVAAFDSSQVALFSAADIEFVGHIDIGSHDSGFAFSPTGLALDTDRHELHVSSLRTDEVAALDLRARRVRHVARLDGARGASGIAFDATADRLLVASQRARHLLFVDAREIRPRGAVALPDGALHVALDDRLGLACVAMRDADALVLVNRGGQVSDLLGSGPCPNHVASDAGGSFFVVNKRRRDDDERGDQVSRIAAG